MSCSGLVSLQVSSLPLAVTTVQKKIKARLQHFHSITLRFSSGKMDSLKLEVNNIIVKINQDNCAVKYCVYRTALKLSQLQDVFHLSEISSSVLFNSLEGHFADADNLLNCICIETVSFNQLNRIISNMLQSVGSNHGSKLVQLLSTLIFETFHDVVDNKVALIAIVLFFIALGNEDLKLKYVQLFDLYSAPLGMLTRSRSGLLLTHIIRLTDIVGESVSFSRINSSVTSCFEGVLGNMVSQQHFLQWVLREPQSVVWLPTMHRLNLAKSSVHDVECTSCKARPIVGLRFQCLKCIDYNSCQVCFLTQQSASRSHKLHHPRQEYCLPAGSKEKLNAFARTLRNIVTKRYKHKSPSSSFLPIADERQVVQSADEMFPEPKILAENRPEVGEENRPEVAEENRPEVAEENPNFGDLSHLAEKERKKLQKIVKKLKTENKKISGTVHLLESSTHDMEGVDDDHALLQSRLDTVTLQNQSLRAELDNLKCVVFAENFTHPSPLLSARAHHEPSCDERNVSTRSDDHKHTQKKKRKKKRVKQSPDTSTESKTEAELQELLNQLQVNLSNNMETGLVQPPVFEAVCQATGEVRFKMNDLIEKTISM